MDTQIHIFSMHVFQKGNTFLRMHCIIFSFACITHRNIYGRAFGGLPYWPNIRPSIRLSYFMQHFYQGGDSEPSPLQTIGPTIRLFKCLCDGIYGDTVSFVVSRLCVLGDS